MLQTTADTAAHKSRLDGLHTVPINEIADTTQKREVAVMPPAEYHKWYKNYKKWCHVDPNAEHTPSPVQLSVLLAILASGACYVDVAL